MILFFSQPLLPTPGQLCSITLRLLICEVPTVIAQTAASRLTSLSAVYPCDSTAICTCSSFATISACFHCSDTTVFFLSKSSFFCDRCCLANPCSPPHASISQQSLQLLPCTKSFLPLINFHLLCSLNHCVDSFLPFCVMAAENRLPCASFTLLSFLFVCALLTPSLQLPVFFDVDDNPTFKRLNRQALRQDHNISWYPSGALDIGDPTTYVAIVASNWHQSERTGEELEQKMITGVVLSYTKPNNGSVYGNQVMTRNTAASSFNASNKRLKTGVHIPGANSRCILLGDCFPNSNK